MKGNCTTLSRLAFHVASRGALEAAAIHGEGFCTSAARVAPLMADNALRSSAATASLAVLLLLGCAAIAVVCATATWVTLLVGFSAVDGPFTVTLVATSLAGFFGASMTVATVPIVVETLLVSLFEDAAAALASAKRRGLVPVDTKIYHDSLSVEKEAPLWKISVALGFANCLRHLIGAEFLVTDKVESLSLSKGSVHADSLFEEDIAAVPSPKGMKEDILMLDMVTVSDEQLVDMAEAGDSGAGVTPAVATESASAATTVSDRNATEDSKELILAAEAAREPTSEIVELSTMVSDVLDPVATPGPFGGFAPALLSPSGLLDGATLAALWKENTDSSRSSQPKPLFSPELWGDDKSAQPQPSESSGNIGPAASVAMAAYLPYATHENMEELELNVPINTEDTVVEEAKALTSSELSLPIASLSAQQVDTNSKGLGIRMHLDLRGVVSASVSKQEVASTVSTPRSEGVAGEALAGSLSGRWPSARTPRTFRGRAEGQSGQVSARSGIATARSGLASSRSIHSAGTSRSDSSNASAWSFACDDFGPRVTDWLEPPLAHQSESLLSTQRIQVEHNHKYHKPQI